MTHRTRAVSASRGQGLEQGPAAGWGGVSGKRGVRFGLLPQRGPPARLLLPSPRNPRWEETFSGKCLPKGGHL